jgi:hypothetical protein
VDMNSLVHGAARKANTPAQAHKLILKRLEGLLDERRPGPTVRASQTLALFSDGPAPLAKLTTQRARRLRGRSASRADGYDEDVVDETKFTTLMISPGTAFSRALAERLDAWAAKRLARGRGFRRVVLSDASVAGEGELKAFEYADTYGDRDVVVYGGDADLVAMALSRCQRRGRLRILDENGRLIDVKSLAKRVAPAHPLDLAVLAIAGGGNDYLPGLQHSAPHLWSALKKSKAGPLWSDGALDRAAFAAVLKACGESREGKGEGDLREAALGRRRADGTPAAPRTIITTLEPRRADLVCVRVLPPRDFGDVASGADTLAYRVRWRRANGGAWCAAQAYETGAPLDAVPLETIKHGVPIRVPAGGGEVEVCASARNSKGWGAVRTQKQRRAKSFCMALGPEEHDAHTAAELGRQPAAAEIPADDEAPAPAIPAPLKRAWDASGWLDQLEWTLAMYVRGRCVDWRLLYAYPSRPSVGDLVRACGAPAPKCVPRPPISPVAALACLIPGRSARALLPAAARTLLDDGSPIASLWWGANDAIDVDAIEAAVNAAVPPTFGTPVIVDAKGRTVVKLLGDGSAAYPPLPRARGGGGRAPPPRGRPVPPPRGPHAAAPSYSAPPVLHAIVPPPPAHFTVVPPPVPSLAKRPPPRHGPPPPPPQPKRGRGGKGSGRGRGRGDASYQPTSSGGGARVPRSRGRGRS